MMNKKMISAMVSAVMVGAMSISAFAAQETVETKTIDLTSIESVEKVQAVLKHFDPQGSYTYSMTTLDGGEMQTILMDQDDLKIEDGGIIVSEEEDGTISILFQGE